MAETDVTNRCIESLNRNPHFRNTLKSAPDAEQRNMITAWYLGYTDVQSAETPSANIDTFVKQVLPQLRKQAA